MIRRSRGHSTGSVQLVGTAHISPQSRHRVITTIQDESPDTVAIELDADRFTRLWNGKHPGVRRLLRMGLTPTAMAIALVFSTQQHQMFEQMDIEPGEADMLPAARTGREVGANVTLIDSPNVDTLNELAARTLSLGAIQSTLGRITDADTRGELRAAADALETFDDDYELTSKSLPERVELLETMPIEEIERLTRIFETVSPAVTDTMLTQRNEHMAGRLHWLRETGDDVVAVVGRAHLPGLQTLLDNPSAIPDTHIVEPRSVRFVTE